MPQMSPMNWMMISLIFLSMYSIMKMKMNKIFKSKLNQKFQLIQKKNNILW